MQRKEQKEEGKEGNSLEKENVLLLKRRKRRTRPSVNYAKDWLGQLFQDGYQFGQPGSTELEKFKKENIG